MEICGQLAKEHSKKNTLGISEYIGKHAERYAILWNLFVHGDSQTQQRASWVVYTHFDFHPELFYPYREEAIQFLSLERHQAVQRALLKLLFLSPIDVDPGILVAKCFDFLYAPKVTVAPKMWSLKIIDRIAEENEDLYSELELAIQLNMNNATAGFKSAANKVLTKINKAKKV
ncbi:MAG: hypothetical protein AAF487_08810 [Bacteroidota bacterium]